MGRRAKEISPEEVERYINDNVPCTIIDVREGIEIAQGMIEQAIHIPLEQLPHSLDQLDQTTEIICVCRSGQRSDVAALFLENEGFSAVNMVGGMLEWPGEIFIR